MIKKFVFSVILCAMTSLSLPAQSKSEVKAIQKEAKSIVRQFEKEGYKILELGDPQELVENYLYGARFGHKQIIGMADDFASRNLAVRTALANAKAEYISLSCSEVRDAMSKSSSYKGKYAEEILSAYEEMSNFEIKGEVNACFTLIREKNRRYDVRVYCLIDHEAAHAANMRAMKRALDVLELSQEFETMVSEWIE